MKKSFIIHPFIVAAFPALALYYYNAQDLRLSVLVLPVLVPIGIALLMFLTTWSICGNGYKAGIIVSLFLALLYSSGHVFNVASWYGITSACFGGVILFLIWAVVFPVSAYLILRTRRTLRYPTIILNAIFIFLLLSYSVRTGIYEVKRLSAGSDNAGGQTTLQLKPVSDPLPDIYYIVLDRYGRADSLADFYDYDNSHFVDYLTDKGFYVASESTANYVRTLFSLTSCLNMDYLRDMDPDSGDLYPLNLRLQDNTVQRSLRQAGYQYIHVGSWWEQTRENKLADVNINYGAEIDEFSELILATTMPYSVCSEMGIIEDNYMRQWKRTLYEFEQLAEIPHNDNPTFVFAHLLVTHPPYVFESDGSFMPSEESHQRTDRDNYVNQMIAANRMLEELVEQLLSKSEVAPIIILQADEGPYPERLLEENREFNWDTATGAELRHKMGILNAFYLPGVDGSALYPSITLVNTFRLVVNLYFGTGLELLPDINYAYEDFNYPFRFLDITDRIERH
jgi:hypothetical protein